MTTPPCEDISDLFPRRFRVWEDDRRPDILNVEGNPKDDDVLDEDDPATGAGAPEDDFWLKRRSLPDRERPVVQNVRFRRDYGRKTHGRRGCITALKRALEVRVGGRWSNPRLIEAMEKDGHRFADPASVDRQLQRLNAGVRRVDAALAVRLAGAFGVPLDDLVFTHEVCVAEDRADEANPIAELENARRERLERRLRNYEVRLTPLGDNEARRELAADIADLYTDRELRHPWRSSAGEAPRRKLPPALRRLSRLLDDKEAPSDRLVDGMRAAEAGLERLGLVVKVGRHIGVNSFDTVSRSERRVTVVVAPAPGPDCIQVDLFPSYCARPTEREEVLDEGDRSVVRWIREDIAWCGHWEGRWFPTLPLDGADLEALSTTSHGGQRGGSVRSQAR